MKIGLFAYGEMGTAALSSLASDFNVDWIIIPSKKDQTLAESRTESVAKKNNIKIYYYSSFSEVEKLLVNSEPELVVISSFNKILPESILEHSKFVNVHLGDLPKMRGRATVNWAIIKGFNKIVISVHKVSAELDSGDIYAKFPIKITKWDSVGDVYKKINKKIESSLARVTKNVLNGLEGKPQRGSPTYYCTRLPNDGLIDFNQKSIDIFNFIRALTRPYPGAFTFFNGKKLIVWNATIPIQRKQYLGRIPGRVISIQESGVEVLTRDSSIILGSVTYENVERNSSTLIKSVRTTLGIDFISVFEKLTSKNDS